MAKQQPTGTQLLGAQIQRESAFTAALLEVAALAYTGRRALAKDAGLDPGEDDQERGLEKLAMPPASTTCEICKLEVPVRLVTAHTLTHIHEQLVQINANTKPKKGAGQFSHARALRSGNPRKR